MKLERKNFKNFWTEGIRVKSEVGREAIFNMQIHRVKERIKEGVVKESLETGLREVRMEGKEGGLKKGKMEGKEEGLKKETGGQELILAAGIGKGQGKGVGAGRVQGGEVVVEQDKEEEGRGLSKEALVEMDKEEKTEGIGIIIDRQ